MADHDDALIEKAAIAVYGNTMLPKHRAEEVAHAVLDAVADDLRQEGARAERVRADRELATYDADLATIEDRDEWKARAEQAEADADEWKRRRDNAVETCRFRHQEGLTAREWHLKICAAAQAAECAEAALSRALADIEALADEYAVSAATEGYGGELWSTTESALRAVLAKHRDRT